MESKEKVFKIPYNDNKRFELKFDLFTIIDHKKQLTKSLHREYDFQGNLNQYRKEKDFLTKNKECVIEQASDFQNVNQQNQQPKLPLITLGNHNQFLYNTSQIQNIQKLNDAHNQLKQQERTDNCVSQNCGQQELKKPSFNLFERSKTKIIKNDFPIIRIASQKINVEVKNIQSQQNRISTVDRQISKQISQCSWFRFNQNISQSDMELLDNNYSWLPNNLLDAMANKFNQEYYKQQFESSTHQLSLIHVFPTTVYDEIERQRKQKSYKCIDCFVYTQEIYFLRKVIQKIYNKFYFLGNDGYHYFLIEVQLQKNIINIYDSMIHRDVEKQDIIKENIQNILKRYKIQIKFDKKEFYPYPRQKDSSNCGIFVLYYLKQLLEGNDLKNFKSPDLDTQKFRHEMKDILMKQRNPKIRILDMTKSK